MNQEVEIFLSYSRRDKQLANELRADLSVLEKQNPSVYIWSTDNMIPGQTLEEAVGNHLEGAQIILLLVSPAFLASNELSLMKEKLEEKQKAGTALVLPIMLRPTRWSQTFLAGLKPLPANGKPLSAWRSRDLAYLEIIDSIKAAIETLKSWTQDEENQLREILKTFSERELLLLCFDFSLNIKPLLEDTSERSGNGLPKVSVDRVIQYMEQQGRIKDLASYVRRNRPTSKETRLYWLTTGTGTRPNFLVGPI
jgi:TIR domain